MGGWSSCSEPLILSSSEHLTTVPTTSGQNHTDCRSQRTHFWGNSFSRDVCRISTDCHDLAAGASDVWCLSPTSRCNRKHEETEQHMFLTSILQAEDTLVCPCILNLGSFPADVKHQSVNRQLFTGYVRFLLCEKQDLKMFKPLKAIQLWHHNGRYWVLTTSGGHPSACGRLQFSGAYRNISGRK